MHSGINIFDVRRRILRELIEFVMNCKWKQPSSASWAAFLSAIKVYTCAGLKFEEIPKISGMKINN